VRFRSVTGACSRACIWKSSRSSTRAGAFRIARNGWRTPAQPSPERGSATRRLAQLLAATFLALPAQAELVEVDLLAPGDKLVTRDTETGLDWLDLGGVTTNLSYDAIQGGAGGWIANGWRYATQAEVCALIVAHTDATTCNFNGVAYNDGLPTAIFISHFTNTEMEFGGTYFRIHLEGIYDDGTPGAVGRARLQLTLPFPPPFTLHQTYSDALPDVVASNDATLTRGSFLVRATPPEVPALPAAAVAALVALLGLAARKSFSHA